MNHLTEQVSFAPAIVLAEGSTSTERKLFVVANASNAALLAIAGEKGKVGKAALERVGNMGLAHIAKAASQGNYRPVADWLAAATGAPVVISGRATFESLPDVFEAKILEAKMAKDGGYKKDKDGMEVPSPKHALALRLKAGCVEIAALATKYAAERKAEMEQRRIENETAEDKAAREAAGQQ